jgi:hypothetical protein
MTDSATRASGVRAPVRPAATSGISAISAISSTISSEIYSAVRAVGPAVVVAVANAARIFDTTSPSRSMMFSTAVNPASRFPR